MAYRNKKLADITAIILVVAVIMGIVFYNQLPFWYRYLDRISIMYFVPYLFRYVWSLRRKSNDEIAELSKRGSVVFLRSFKDEDSIVATENKKTIEQSLNRLFSSTGPFIGLGNPRERWAKAGAKRAYFDYESWQEQIIIMINTAKLVVIKADDTPSLIWEIEKVKSLLSPDKVVLFFPPTFFNERTRVNNFWRFMEEMQIKMPDQIVLHRFWTFDSDWVAHPINPTAYDNKLTLLKSLLSSSNVLIWLQELKPWIESGKLRTPKYRIGLNVKLVKEVIFFCYLLILFLISILPIYSIIYGWPNKVLIILSLVTALFIFLHIRMISRAYEWKLLWSKTD